MKLYGYYRSSTSYRVRIALNLKDLSYDQVHVNLLESEQRTDAYKGLNPQGLVPVLETEDHNRLTQSVAICEYLEERYPQPPLLPSDAYGRARVRALVNLLACEIHPVNNLRVLKYLTGELGVGEEAKLAWYHHWLREGFAPLEALLADQPETGEFCHGDSPTLADVCLVPQVFNAIRFDLDLTPYPTIRRIHERCNELPAFDRARPENNTDQ